MLQYKSLFMVMIGLLISTSGALSANDEVEELKKQNAALKKEVELLRRERDLLQKELDQLRPKKGETTEKRPEGEIIGVAWEIDVYRPDGTVFTTQKFLAAEGKIYFDAREVGTYTENGNRVRIDVTRSTSERAIGVFELLRISNKPPIYAGRFRNKKGENPKVQLRIIKD